MTEVVHRPSTIAELLRMSAADAGAQPAVLGIDGEVVTYQALLDLRDGLASSLAEHGVAPTDVVAIAMPNGTTLGCFTVATMSVAGCAPLNPVVAAPEAAHLLADLAPTVLVVRHGHQSKLRDVASSLGIPMLEIRDGSVADAVDHGTWTAASGPGIAPSEPDSGTVALRLHTSGTTGVPKQVPLTHANLIAATYEVVASLSLDPGDRCLNLMPLFHSHGLLGALLSTIAARASICCTPGFDPRYALTWASELGATWYTAAPAVHNGMLSAPGEHRGFRLIRSASASLPDRLRTGLEERFGAPVIEVYGMTEAYQIAANPLSGERRAGTVGVPTGDEIALLAADRAGRAGEGEIVVRGPNVFGGYASPAGANDTAFFDDWFRTGDLGRFDEAGYLRITGRLKEQINRGGEKISPREVDDALLAHPEVLEALCAGFPDDALGEDIGAAVVTRSGAAVDVPELRRFLAQRVAPFKVPRRFAFVDAIPLSSGGKPSRPAVGELLEALSSARAAPGVVPAPGGDDDGTSTASRLATLWRSVLAGTEPITPDAHFFDLGGSSLDVMELVTQVEEVFGVDLPIDDVLELPTLQDMADEIDQLLSGESRRAVRHLRVMRPGSSAGAVLLVPGAHGMAIGLQPVAQMVEPGPMVLGFAYPGQAPGEAPLQSIEALSGTLIDALRDDDVHVRVVFGNSLGSWVAFEAARQLTAAGEPPLGVVLGDMYSPTLARAGRRGVRRVIAAARALLHRRRRRAEAQRALAEERHDAVFRASNVALASYRGGPHRGTVHLLTTHRRAARITSPTYHWEDLVDGEIGVTAVEGEHEELHTDHAEVIAAQINALLAGGRVNDADGATSA